MKKLIHNFFILISIILSLTLFVFSVRGRTTDHIYYQKELTTDVGGPYEASNSTSRYALIISLVEQGTVFFDDRLAAFSTPDIASMNGKHFSIFTPGVSILAMPLYYLGKLIGYPQLTTYLFNPILAIWSMYLAYKLARHLESPFWSCAVSAYILIFGTNILSYTQSLTQHLAAVTALLILLINSTSSRSVLKNIVFGLVYGIALLIDIPNAIMFLPILIHVIFKHFSVEKKQGKTILKVKASLASLAFGVIPTLLLFGWYNHETTGSYFQLPQNIGRADYVDNNSLPKIEPIKPTESENDNNSVFDTRDVLTGLYTLIISDERGITEYQPIVLLGIIGAMIIFRRHKHRDLLLVMLAVVLTNILIYAMFGDPWGGWSYGPRYLIPASSILCTLLAPFINAIRKKWIYLLPVMIITVYSLYINTLGVLTTSSVPPKHETYRLVKPIPYTHQYNLDLLNQGQASSLLYDIYLDDYINALQFFYLYFGLTCFIGLILFVNVYRNNNTVKDS